MEVTETAPIDPAKVPMCSCVDEQGQKYVYAVVKVSKTEKNPGREFFSCHLSKANGGCGFFSFADEIYTDMKTGLARKKYIKRETAPTANEQKGLIAQLEERISVLEQLSAESKQRIQNLEEGLDTLKNTLNPVITLDELPPAKSQKTAGPSTRGKPRAKILP
jgi:hypothetical protein